MTYGDVARQDFVFLDRNMFRSHVAPIVLLAIAFVFCISAGTGLISAALRVTPAAGALVEAVATAALEPTVIGPAVIEPIAAGQEPVRFAALLDRSQAVSASSNLEMAALRPALGGSPQPVAAAATPRAEATQPGGTPVALVLQSVPPAPGAVADASESSPRMPSAGSPLPNIPLPTPRPSNLLIANAARAGAAPDHRIALAQLETPAGRPAGPQSILEKLFGAAQPSQPQGSALAYAAPDDGALRSPVQKVLGNASPFDHFTAIYDIAAHTVTLPDGTKLEAHSGLGAKLDDPRSVRIRMSGATPPNVYDLQLREQLFHGVRALRLTPAGNGAMFGRAGLLAHTYMLGPRGDSNGCVAFKNYQAFLQAFDAGQVKRLAVVERLN